MLYHLSHSAWLYLAPVALGVLRSFFNQHLRRPLRRFLPSLDPFVTVDVAAKPEDHSYYYGPEGSAKSSDAYGEVLAYLSAACSREARELRAEGAAEGHGLVLSLREGQEVADELKGVTLWWSAVPHPEAARRCCRLTFHERHRGLVVDEYLPYVRRTGQELASRNRPRRLYSNKKDLNYQCVIDCFILFMFCSSICQLMSLSNLYGDRSGLGGTRYGATSTSTTRPPSRPLPWTQQRSR
jgi:chaperone BCS1